MPKRLVVTAVDKKITIDHCYGIVFRIHCFDKIWARTVFSGYYLLGLLLGNERKSQMFFLRRNSRVIVDTGFITADAHFKLWLRSSVFLALVLMLTHSDT
jgi:nucleoside recognition membrane protein YjiH